MARRLGTSLLALGALAFLVSAASAGPHGHSMRGGTLNLTWGAQPDSLDPALARGYVGSWSLLFATCSKLFMTVPDRDTGTPRVVPEVVRNYSISNADRTYTFELKRTFRFHTGARVTAWSFARAFNRDADPLLGSPAARLGFMREITGADAAMHGTAKAISGVQVLGPYRLRIRLKHRASDFLARLTMPYFCPILPGMPTDPEGVDEPPGSGPYYVAENVPNQRIVLERNPYYGGQRSANPDRIVWTIEGDWSERLRATEEDESDLTTLGFGYPSAVMRDLVATYGLNRPGGRLFQARPGFSNWLFLFNPERPWFRGAGGAALRKAINYALDRAALIRAHPYLSVRRSDRVLPASLSESRPLYPRGAPDLGKARRWLARAGRPPPALTLYTGTFSFSAPSANVFVSSLKQLGIEVRPVYLDFLQVVKKLHATAEPWDVLWFPWFALYPDPAGALVPLLHGTRYAARIDAANRVTGAAARARAWAGLEADLMTNDPPVAAYADSTPLVLVSSRFGCWQPPHGAPRGLPDLDLGAVCKK